MAMTRIIANSSAKTVTEPASAVAVEASIVAVTVFTMMLAPSEMPTAAFVPLMPIPPANERIDEESLADTAMSPVPAVTVEASSMLAVTVLVTTLIAVEPPIPGPSATPIPAPMARHDDLAAEQPVALDRGCGDGHIRGGQDGPRHAGGRLGRNGVDCDRDTGAGLLQPEPECAGDRPGFGSGPSL